MKSMPRTDWKRKETLLLHDGKKQTEGTLKKSSQWETGETSSYVESGTQPRGQVIGTVGMTFQEVH